LKRKIATYQVENIIALKQQMLSWANQFNICCLLDNNDYKSTFNSFEFLLGVGSNKSYTTSSKINEFNRLKEFIENNNDWLMGHIAYDFKNHLFPLESKNINEIGFPDTFLFQPEIVIKLIQDQLIIESLTTNPQTIFDSILQTIVSRNEVAFPSPMNIQPKIKKEDYISIINQLKKHLQQGDCYEITFCQEFFARNSTINPLLIYCKLNAISPSPFSAFYKLNNQYLLCASPERFIKKSGNTIISQPIKGTAKRNSENIEQDELLKQQLLQSQKERSENVMIVDLVRNDLSRIAERNSVQVDELFGIFSFPQLHQMISTISATIDININVADVLKALFPMGSMTGAPKYKVMQLIEEYEQSKRGIYSGCVGYITPQNDFDFNVVIRSIMYNEQSKYISYQVGGAITHYSNAEAEYEECLLKAKAMEKALQ
jgi:para-aminobenzoate synthetase component 1